MAHTYHCNASPIKPQIKIINVQVQDDTFIWNGMTKEKKLVAFQHLRERELFILDTLSDVAISVTPL